MCGVFCVHGSAGAIGTWLIPVFAVSGFSLAQFTMQTVGILVITVWTLVTSYLIFKLADVTVGLRVDEKEEHTGLDSSEHGIVGLPRIRRILRRDRRRFPDGDHGRPRHGGRR